MKLDNKKLVKIMVVTGAGLLIVFIIVRLATKNNGGQITDMPSIGELNYNPKKVKEESKIEQFEQQKKESEQKAMGYQDNSNFEVPNFNKLIENGEKQTAQQATDNNSKLSASTNTVISQKQVSSQVPTSSNSIKPPNNSSSPKSSSTPKLNYQSDYFKSNKEPEPIAKEPSEQENTSANKNPFGTISNDNNQVTKQQQIQTGYYSAEIYGDQKIEDGGVVLIRNTSSIQYLNLTIPRNSILYGQAFFKSNRVFVTINRAKTTGGEYSVAFGVRDNDKIEGLYYKAPIDETVDKTKEDVNPPPIPIPGQYGQIINGVAQSVVKGGKELMKKSKSLTLEEGYKLYVIQK